MTYYQLEEVLYSTPPRDWITSRNRRIYKKNIDVAIIQGDVIVADEWRAVPFETPADLQYVIAYRVSYPRD